MSKKNSFLKWWYFKVNNPIVREGEAGGFKWCFRRFTLDISTLSGNFKARFTADEHPYAYLLAGKDDANIHGFCQTIYAVGQLLTSDQVFAKSVQKSIFNTLKCNGKALKHSEIEEETALQAVKEVQEHIELPKKARKKADKEIDRRFKKAVKHVGENKKD